jgi:hypothetical protein
VSGRNVQPTLQRAQPWCWNQGLNFTTPYLHDGQAHDYVPDFIVRLKTDPPKHLILETKGFDPREEVKRAAAERWVAAVNAEGTYGRWVYACHRHSRPRSSSVVGGARPANLADRS